MPELMTDKAPVAAGAPANPTFVVAQNDSSNPWASGTDQIAPEAGGAAANPWGATEGASTGSASTGGESASGGNWLSQAARP